VNRGLAAKAGPAVPRQDIMVDIETCGRGPGCAIVSIGAVMFDRVAGLGSKFYMVTNLGGQLGTFGLRKDPDTMAWWSKQSEDARETMEQAAAGHGTELPSAFSEFALWAGPCGGNVRLWGNGADFDNAILAYAHEACGMTPFWKFWNNRCFRTLKALYPPAGAKMTGGIRHNALDDAVHQAERAVEALRAMAGVGTRSR
jgi:exodeoxyribonuclease VIII